ncbi:MAG: PilZ domain-containing protein [Candidatus Poribacteria bacterium]|nr:PilZ domain-containing protein [Candidatus Poribacteria bacterium]
MQSPEKHSARAFIRVDKEMIIQYRALPSSEPTDRIASAVKTKNVSVVGICFRSPSQLPVGDQLVIELHLPSHEEPITPVARVVWCRPGGAGHDVGLELMWFDWQADEQLIFANYIHGTHGQEMDQIYMPPAELNSMDAQGEEDA